MSIDLTDPELRASLERIVEHEEEKEHNYKTNPTFAGMDHTTWWEMYDVPVEWKYVRRLYMAKILKKFGKKYYCLVNREQTRIDMATFNGLRTNEQTRAAIVTEGKLFPDDLFDIIEGYDELKVFFKIALQADEPVHALMVGAPGTAKSLFMMELERLGGRFITAGTATRVGIRDILYDDLPSILIIDEIEKIDSSKDLSSLLTWMQDGRIIVTKHGLKDEKEGKGWVFAACNRLRGLPPELLDRFQVFYIKQYTRDEFLLVVRNYLIKRMDVPEDLAAYIAQKTQEFTVSVRQAIRIAQLAKTPTEVDDLLSVFKKYAPPNHDLNKWM